MVKVRSTSSTVIKALYSSPHTPIDVDALLPPELGPWPVSRSMARSLARIVAGLQCRSVLEFGAGWSSLLLAQSLAAAGGGRLTSVEHEPKYLVKDLWERVERTPGVDAALVVTGLHRRLSTHGLLWSYRNVGRLIASRAPFDLLLIDGPPARYGRASPLHDTYQFLAPGAVIVLDDAARRGEQTIAKEWLATYRGLELVVMDRETERGIAVFVHDGTKGRRVAARAVARSFRERWRHFRLDRSARPLDAATAPGPAQLPRP